MRKPGSVAFFSIAVLVLAAGAGVAQQQRQALTCWQELAAADDDGDGFVSPREAEASLARAFLRMDLNRDGVITVQEHRNCLLDAGSFSGQILAPHRTQKRFAAIDRNSDGYVSLEEYVEAGEAAFAQAAAGAADAPLSDYTAAIGEQGSGMPDIDEDERVSQTEAALDVLRTFALMDVDSDRRIGRLEWATVVEQPKFLPSFRALDGDGDGRVTMDEMAAAWAAGAKAESAGRISVWRHAQSALLPDVAARQAKGEGRGTAAGGSRRPASR